LGSFIIPTHIFEQVLSVAIEGHHGAIWEALPTLEFLLAEMEAGKRRPEGKKKKKTFLVASYNNAWLKLKKDYNLTDEAHQPTLRKNYFDTHWTEGEAPGWIDIVVKYCKEAWQREYSTGLQQADIDQGTLDAFMFGKKAIGSGDEFDLYTLGTPASLAKRSEFHIINW
jgi:hypothetical protein